MARVTEDLRYFVMENTHASAKHKGGRRFDIIPMRSIAAYNANHVRAEDLELSDAVAKVKELEAEKGPGELF